MFQFIKRLFNKSKSSTYINKVINLKSNYSKIFDSNVQYKQIEFLTGDYKQLIDKIEIFRLYMSSKNLEGLSSMYIDLRTIHIQDLITIKGRYITKKEFNKLLETILAYLYSLETLGSIKTPTPEEKRTLLSTNRMSNQLYLLIDILSN